jgi:hypothetical protein
VTAACFRTPFSIQPYEPEAIGGSLLDVRFLAPFTTLPGDPNESPGEGWIRNGRNWWYPDTSQSLSPNFNHAPPKGPHYDLHTRGKPKIGLRMNGPDIEFWSDEFGEWFALDFLE